MSRARQRRPKPAATTPQEDADLEARYRVLFRLLRRYRARTLGIRAEYGDRSTIPLG